MRVQISKVQKNKDRKIKVHNNLLFGSTTLCEKVGHAYIFTEGHVKKIFEPNNYQLIGSVFTTKCEIRKHLEIERKLYFCSHQRKFEFLDYFISVLGW